MTSDTPRRGAGLVEFIRFVAIGSIAAIANLVSRYLLNFLMPFEWAVPLAWIVGMVIAFLMFQRVIFGNPGTPLRRRVIRFTQVNILGGALAWAISVMLANWFLPLIGWTFHPLELAHIVGVGVPAFTSYFLHKFYTFR